MGYQPIENYGVIGNMHTVALVGMNGSIDWFCCPNFDSPSVFAAILDDQKGGHFQIAPAVAGATHKQIYWPETNVLVTRFLSPAGVAEVIDFMPVESSQERHEHSELIRRVNVVRGAMPFRMECFPAFNYARDDHKIEMNESGAAFRSPGLSLQLSATVPLQQSGQGLTAEFTLNEGQTVTFAIGEIRPDIIHRRPHPPSLASHGRRSNGTPR